MKRLSRSTRRKIGVFLAAVARSLVDGKVTPQEAAEIMRAARVMVDAIRDDFAQDRGGEE